MRRRKIVPGETFGEYIHTEKIIHHKNNSDSIRSMRVYLLPLLLIISLGFLLIKLFLLQVLQGSYYRGLSDTNRMRTTIIPAPRGIIFDRNNTPLVFNTPGFFKLNQGKVQFLTKEEADLAVARGEKNLYVVGLREYPYKEVLSHELGYIGQISENELGRPEFATYHSGDIVGKMGIEQEYESILRGTDGKKLIEVDASGKIKQTLGQTEPIPGQDMHITIDKKLQQVVYNAMRDVKKGAAIVSTPKGEILAMVSKPTFDPNLFTMGKTYHVASTSAYQNISDIIMDGNSQPLLNRVISGTYPPGSTFKIVNAAAGLEDNVINSHFTINDTGILKIGTFSFANWYYTQYGKTEGEINVVGAIKRSNDIFFYKLAEMNGVDRLSSFARKFGVGSELGIDLPGEVPGLVPTKEWKLKTIGEQWYTGDDYHYGIGQGYLLTTPLQVNAWTGVIANGGTLYKPHFLLQNDDQYKLSKQPFLSQSTLSLIQTGMVEACSAGGVAWPLFNYQVKNPKLTIDNHNITSVASSSADMRHVAIACKTGTAEHGDVSVTEPHAWITLFAPAYNPQIVVTVLSESAGEGSNVAGPIAKQIVDEWFNR